MKFSCFRIVFVVFFFSIFSVSCASFSPVEIGSRKANSEESKEKPYLLVVSIDGFRKDYLNWYDLPFIKQFANSGVSAEALLPGYPSKTFNNHYSIATGLYSENHGIVANVFFDSQFNEIYKISDSKTARSGKWYAGVPFWVAAEMQGMKTATYFWPGSEAEIAGYRPSYFKHFGVPSPESDRVSQIVKWFEKSDDQRPHLVTLYFSEVDAAGHRFGPRSDEVHAELLKVDQTLAKISEELKSLPFEVNWVILSDHGMSEVDSDKVLFLEDLIQVDGKTPSFFSANGTQGFIYESDSTQRKKYLQTLKRNSKGRYEVYEKKNLPRSYRYSKNRRIADIVVDMIPPYALVKTSKVPIRDKGVHGYAVHRTREMETVFFAKGPRFKSQFRIPAFENVHVYPMILRVLNLEPVSKVDGRSSILDGILLDQKKKD